MNKKIVIGLFGFGVVGEGLYNVLQKAPNANAVIKKIVVVNKNKNRNIPSELISYNADDIFEDKEINLIVEVINNSEDAYKIVKRALINKINVVTGSKSMLANHLEELIELQKQNETSLLYDASACGSIPIIRNLEEYYDNDLLTSVTGILNGSSNYILTKIFNHNSDYKTALQEAQDLGFAETDPSFDVDGFDSLFKLVIITVHAFGTFVNHKQVFNTGISKIKNEDIQYAREKGKKIKLVGQVVKTENNNFSMFVIPKLVSKNEYIYSVENEFNGVVIEGEFYDKQFMFGKGAGGFPTGSSVLSDITASSHNYKYEYKKKNYFNAPKYTTDINIKIYLRFNNLVDFSFFKFTDVVERYSSENYNYVIGTINLSELLKIKDAIPSINVFMALVD